MRVSLEDLGALNWSLCPLSEDLRPLADPKELAVIRRPLSTWGDEVAAWGVVTGPISKVWAARKPDSAAARVANPLGLWGLIPGGPKPPKVHPAGTVVPVVGPGITWVSGSPGALAGDDFAATVAAAVAGDRDSLIGLVRSAAKASGVEVLPTLDRADGWQEVSWPEPPPTIPWGDILPGDLGYITEHLSASTGADLSVAGLLVTGHVSSALMARYRIEMLTPNGVLWTEHPGLYALGVASSSGKKSPQFDALEGPFKVKNNDLHRDSMAVRQDWLAQKASADAMLRAGKADAADLEDAALRSEAAEPVIRRLYQSADATPEAIVRDASQWPSLTVITPEASELFDRCVRETGANMQGLLHMWSGESYNGGSRIGRPILTKPGTKLRGAIIGGIQGGVLHKLGKNRRFFDQGLMARFLYAIADRVRGGGDALPRDFHSRWARLLQAIWAQPEVKRDADGTDHGEPRPIQVSPRGTQLLKDFETRMLGATDLGGDLFLLATWAGKAHGQAARLAACWAVALDPRCKVIPDDLVRTAINAVEGHLLPHAVAAWDLSHWPEGSDLAQHLWTRCAVSLGPVWSRAEIARVVGRVSPSPDAQENALRILEKRGFVRPVEGSKTTYLPNPIALDATLGAC